MYICQMMKAFISAFFWVFFLVLLHTDMQVWGQRPGLGGMMRGGGQSSGGPYKDSLQHRTGLEDSASILYRTMHEDRYYFQDSSVHDFTRRWPMPWSHIFLGNNGSASRSLLFSPLMMAGWDHGFHAFDPYQSDIYNSRFYNVTRPFSELSYILGPRREQNIGVFHTQNIRYNWNVSFDYKLLNAPGIFKNQKNSHNRYLLNSWYRSKNGRYAVFVAAGSSRTGASENGGMKDIDLLNDLPTYSDRSILPTNLGGSQFEQAGLLSNTINTGNIYEKKEILIRNSFDFGHRDSVKVDTSMSYFYVSRFSLQHTYQHKTFRFRFADTRFDSLGYAALYGLELNTNEFRIEEQWQLDQHELALVHYPDPKNKGQLIKGAVGYQQIQGRFQTGSTTLENVFWMADYRNKTRNGKWDIRLNGQFFATGNYAGDYQGDLTMTRFMGKKNNLLTLGLQSINRTPSFIHNDLSSFKLFNRGNTAFAKENYTLLSAQYKVPDKMLEVGLRYYVMSNFVYFGNSRQSFQESTLFNVAQLTIARKFTFRRSWSWYAEAIIQKATALAPVNLPLLVTRNRFAYEGRHFRQLNLSTGLEMRYVSSFKADEYSPMLGQFYLQQDRKVSNLPDLTAYLHFRIRSWYLFMRAENLNAITFTPQFGFFANNLATPTYPMPGLIFRLGIYWGFVN